jgi:hypothetical protein
MLFHSGMKQFSTILCVLLFCIAAHAFNDSLAQQKVNEMRKIAEHWKTFPSSFDTVFCGGYCKKGEPRPVYFHAGNFPAGSDFDFMKAEPGDVLGPYVDGNCVGVYRFVEKTMTCDSMQIAQILIAWKGATNAPPYVKRDRDHAKLLADSICKELRQGRIFIEEIGTWETDDPGSWSGNHGNYGWLTRESDFPVDLLDAGFNNDTGTFGVVETPLGFHVIQVLKHSEYWESYCAWEIVQEIDSCSNRYGRPRVTPCNFPGGIAAMNNYFESAKAKYDSLHSPFDEPSPVLVLFDVLEDGSTTNVQVFKQWWITPGIVRGLTCLVKDMPKWNPARTCEGTREEGVAVIIYL